MISTIEANRAVRRLCAHFLSRAAAKQQQLRFPTGSRESWEQLAEHVTGLIFQRKYPGFQPADTVSSDHTIRVRAVNRLRERQQLGLQVLTYILDKEWDQGKLLPPVREVDRRALLTARLKRWETRAKRANTAIRKLRRAIKRIDSKVEPR